MRVGRGPLLLNRPYRPRLRLWPRLHLWPRLPIHPWPLSTLPLRSHLNPLDHYPAGNHLAQRQSRGQPQAT
jgi:hypothetical protein